MDIIIISGLSGAGKSRAAAVLEDMNYYCVDNMPVSMMFKFAELSMEARGKYEHVALVADVRNIGDFDELFTAIDDIRALGCKCSILFVEAKLTTIIRRYKETRRRHPMYKQGVDLATTVAEEQERMQPIREKADYIIDTTGLTLSRLQRSLLSMLSGDIAPVPMGLTFISFGYKNGLPIDADIVFDVRFLPNPYYVPELREKTGLDEDVYNYIFDSEVSVEAAQRFADMLKFLVPYYIEEGKRNLVVAVGCTGGHHRSVAMAVRLAEMCAETGCETICAHRDLER